MGRGVVLLPLLPVPAKVDPSLALRNLSLILALWTACASCLFLMAARSLSYPSHASDFLKRRVASFCWRARVVEARREA